MAEVWLGCLVSDPEAVDAEDWDPKLARSFHHRQGVCWRQGERAASHDASLLELRAESHNPSLH